MSVLGRNKCMKMYDFTKSIWLTDSLNDSEIDFTKGKQLILFFENRDEMIRWTDKKRNTISLTICSCKGKWANHIWTPSPPSTHRQTHTHTHTHTHTQCTMNNGERLSGTTFAARHHSRPLNPTWSPAFRSTFLSLC